MTNSHPSHSHHTLPLDALEQIEPLCSQFEDALRRGDQPNIVDYLRQWQGPDLHCLLTELLKLELEYRLRRGEVPKAEDYQERLAEHLELVEALIDQQAAGAVFSSTVTVEAIAPRIGSDRYDLRQFHARGGMGEVWVAADNDIGRRVALKRIREGRDHSRFLAEAQITGKLEHPSIVPVYDLGVDDAERPYYVMKFVDGRTLKDAIADFHRAEAADPGERAIRSRQLLAVLLDLCDAVSFAHSRGVIHRDIKPDNVMLGEFGETVVLDWGLAKLLDQPDLPDAISTMASTKSSGSAETSPGSVIGTPSYMPPELAEGHADNVTPATDVYLLGATLYEILTGEAPRKGRSKDEMVELARTVPPTAPRDLRCSVPRSLDAFCRKAMAMRPEDRYQEIGQLSDDIRRYLAGEPVEAYREAWPTKAARWARRHRRQIGWLSAASIIFALAAFGLVSRRHALALQLQEQTRDEVAAVRQQLEELVFLAAGSDERDEELVYYDPQNKESRLAAISSSPRDDELLYFDPAAAADLSERILRETDAWGDNLQNLPLDDAEKQTVRNELYEALLILCQLQSNKLDSVLDVDQKQAEQLLAMLDRARALRQPAPPTRSYYRLRKPYDPQDEPQGVEVDALERFLLGEQLRVSAPEVQDANEQFPTYARRDLQPAIESYRYALRLDPDHFWAHLQLGRCYLGMGQTAKAVETLGTCIALRPESSWAYIARGLALTMEQRYGDALDDFNEVIGQSPVDALAERQIEVARLHRSLVHQRQGETDLAMDSLTSLSGSRNKQITEQAAYRLGKIHYQNGQYKDAIVALKKCLTAASSNLRQSALQTLAKASYLDRQNAQGSNFLDQYLSLALPGRQDKRLLRGMFLRDLAAHLPKKAPRRLATWLLKQAEGELLKAIAAAPSSKAYHQLALVQLRLRSARVFNACNKGLALNPRSIELLDLRGSLYFDSKPDRAKKDFAQVLEIRPQESLQRVMWANSAVLLGCLEAADNKRLEAERLAGRTMLALSSQPEKHYLVYHNLACIYGELSKSDQQRRAADQQLALDYLEEAIRRSKDAGVLQKALRQIDDEKAFPDSMEQLPRFQQLIEQAKN